MTGSSSGRDGEAPHATGSVRQSDVRGVAVAVTGAVSGDVNVHVGQPSARSAYAEQVRRIAPRHLADRDLELAELASFCTKPDQGPYVWWQAPAWAGKSALMSWFVLHPPPGVQTVAFFITARFAGQSDRIAFTDVVLEQLSALLGQPMPAYLTEATRDAHLLATLTEAAKACQRRQLRLVLVVDGLDEDRGVTTGPDAHSIAALLPPNPPAGMRIIVAGRPNPPVPSDVPDDHPLRDPAVVRMLDTSPHAQVVRVDAQRELKRLLHGTRTEQDLLGLLTAAGGGLTGRDLSELLGHQPWQIEETLHAMSGRTFARRVSAWRPGVAPEVYLLAHEELQTAANRFLGGDRLDEYRRRLHAWAGRYRDRGWPAETPEYLLRGYFQMAHATGALAAMVACATDPARHDRMLDVTDGDTAALTEIIDAQDAILGLDEPDLLTMARLSIRRTALAERNAHVPPDLPAVWVAAGQPGRAEALAHAITEPYHHALALTDLMKATAATGDHARARVLAEQAEAAARTVASNYDRDRALTSLVDAMAETSDADRADALIDAIDDPERRARAWTTLAAAATVAGDHDRAEALVSNLSSHPGHETEARTALAEVAAGAGQHSRARTLAESAVAIGATFSDHHARALASLVRVLAAAGDRDRAKAASARADAVIETFTDPEYQARALIDLAGAITAAGDHERAGRASLRAEKVAATITDPYLRAQALIGVMYAVAEAGDDSRVRTLAQRAEAAADTLTRPDQRADALRGVAEALAAARESDRAETTARAITDPHQQAQALAAVAEAAAAAGDHDRAEAVARTIALPDQRARALTRVAKASIATGDYHRARALAAEAEMVARTATDADQQSQALTALAASVAVAGDRDRAQALAERAENAANTIHDPYRQARSLMALVTVLASADDPHRARALADRAQTVAQTITAGIASGDLESTFHSDWQADVLITLSKTMAAIGDHDWAEAMARDIANPYQRADTLIAIAKVVAASGDPDRAEAMARTITDPHLHVRAVTELVRTAVAARDHHRAQMLVAQATGALPNVGLVAKRTRSDWTEDHAALTAAETLAAVAGAFAATGDHERARVFAGQAEGISGTITYAGWRADVLGALANVVATTGDHDQAEAMAGSIQDTRRRAVTFATLAQTFTTTDQDRAKRLAELAETDMRTITDADWRIGLLTALIPTMAATGGYDRAEALAQLIPNTDAHARALADLAKHVTDPRRARRLIARAFRLGGWTAPLDALVRIEPAVLMAIADEYLP